MKLLKNFLKKTNRNDRYYWEYYNRLHFISSAIKKLNLPPSAKILDVGGATGDNLLAKFEIPNVTTLDISADADMVASADNIPAADNSYDIVTCIDTLEHIPSEKRERVIHELIRAASRAVFIAAPVDSAENNKAERLVLKYVKNKFIEEHQKYGLVDFRQIKSLLREKKNSGLIESFEIGELDDLLNWVIMMTAGYVDENAIYQEAYFLENKFHPRRCAISIYKTAPTQAILTE